MREDMARVIVERPRKKVRNSRKGRPVAYDDMPFRMGMRRGAALHGETKDLNENLAPLRRYLESQVGRPWSKVYSEVARHLRIENTVHQHVRDHIRDFVAVKPRRVSKGWRLGDRWWQPLYVDPRTGLLCRTDQLPEAKARRRAGRNRPPAPIARIVLGTDCELRLVSGIWYHVQLAPMPEAIYRIYREVQTRYRNGYSARGGTYEMEINVGRLVTPGVRDVVTGELIAVGPDIDDIKGWKRYRHEHPSRFYPVAKRTLSYRELRRHGVANAPPDER